MDIDTQVSLDTLISDAAAAEDAVKQAQIVYESKLAQIVQSHGSSTFLHNGQWFQIRTRKSDGRDMTYLCKLRAEPKTWLRGRPKGSVNRKKNPSLTDEAPMDGVEFSNSTFVVLDEDATDGMGMMDGDTTVIE
jgi:hypothetical protein